MFPACSSAQHHAALTVKQAATLSFSPETPRPHLQIRRTARLALAAFFRIPQVLLSVHQLRLATRAENPQPSAAGENEIFKTRWSSPPLSLSRAHLAGLRCAGGGVELGVGLGVVGVEGLGPRPFEVDCENRIPQLQCVGKRTGLVFAGAG